MNDEQGVSEWITCRMQTADIVRHYFDLKHGGRVSENDVESIFDVVQKLMLGSCAFFSSVIARQASRDQMVCISSVRTGHLLHSVFACSPQYETKSLKGDFVDILGRGTLLDLLGAMERIAGPVSVQIGGVIDPEDYLEGEETTLLHLARSLPWTRQFVGIRTVGESPNTISALKKTASFYRDGERPALAGGL